MTASRNEEPTHRATIERVSAFHKRIHSEIVIDASPDEVWGVLTDWERLPEWSPTLQSVQGDVRDGQRVKCVYNFRGNLFKPEHVLLYSPGKEFGWSDPILPGLTDRHMFRVEALEDGRTRFVQEDEVRGVLSPVLGWYFLNEMLTSYPSFNEALKLRVEGA